MRTCSALSHIPDVYEDQVRMPTLIIGDSMIARSDILLLSDVLL